MQRRCKHAFPAIEKLCFLRDPSKVVIKKTSVREESLKDLVVSPKWVLYSKTDWPADRRS
jgi:hypothetical protein